jgi:hypothetical protein
MQITFYWNCNHPCNQNRNLHIFAHINIRIRIAKIHLKYTEHSFLKSVYHKDRVFRFVFSVGLFLCAQKIVKGQHNQTPLSFP